MRNPFEFEAASNLSDEEILDFYIEDHNFSRFILSSRNIFLSGERGTGKTMTLLYNSFRIEYRKAKNLGIPFTFEKIGIHIPCKTPLIYKKEFELIADFRAFLIGEHYLSLYILHELASNLQSADETETAFENSNETLKTEFEYITSSKLHPSHSFLKSIELFVKKEVIDTQRKVNDQNSDEFYYNTYSFNSLVLPVLRMIKSVKLFSKSHFLFMLDDAHDLNSYQIQTVNSWIAYRDHSDFSFKVAITSDREYSFTTASGGSIIEGHDFTKVERENPYRSSGSDFGKMARDIIGRRLKLYLGIDENPESFFPINPEMEEDLATAKNITLAKAKLKFPKGTPKQINDYVYKYARAEYFRSRSGKANLPPYSGFDTIVQLSTGVIRNLLTPCYEMFDMAMSESGDNKKIDHIPWHIQSKAIEKVSKRKWESINSLHRNVEGCSELQKEYIYNLFNNLAILLRQRLYSDISEPRAIKFKISDASRDAMRRLDSIINIAQKAQLLYVRLGRDKDNGENTLYYELNRLLLPDRGLDPVGQHSTISIRASALWNAASKDKKIPFDKLEVKQNGTINIPFE
ncbi:ORC-CDC6 family AAA ATPase [Dyadobacter sp. OTU695]|uniref:ORC-CDC6 family AAA ATPase n=1 Tax=Dyadobacter sp. OTU695 TaxID=3043860 RepID=UPI00313B9339